MKCFLKIPTLQNQSEMSINWKQAFCNSVFIILKHWSIAVYHHEQYWQLPLAVTVPAACWYSVRGCSSLCGYLATHDSDICILWVITSEFNSITHATCSGYLQVMQALNWNYGICLMYTDIRLMIWYSYNHRNANFNNKKCKL